MFAHLRAVGGGVGKRLAHVGRRLRLIVGRRSGPKALASPATSERHTAAPRPDRTHARSTALVTEHQRLVRGLAKRYARRFPTADVADLEQEGAIGLLRAAKLYKKGRGAQFATFAHPHIESRIRRAAQASHGVRLPERKIQKGVKLLTVGGESGRKKLGRLTSSGGIERGHARATVARLATTARLSPELRRVIQLRYGDDHTVSETAKALGRGKATIHAMERKALAQLRAASLPQGRD